MFTNDLVCRRIPSGASQPIGIFHTLRNRVKTIFMGLLGRWSLSLCVCLPHTTCFFLAPLCRSTCYAGYSMLVTNLLIKFVSCLTEETSPTPEDSNLACQQALHLCGMQKEVWENAWASGEALASPCVTFVTPPNRELAHRLTQTHTHITVTNKVLLLHTPNWGPIQCNTWFLHCVQIIKTITYYTFHVMWDELVGWFGVIKISG